MITLNFKSVIFDHAHDNNDKTMILYNILLGLPKTLNENVNIKFNALC